jgi:hypothetical protein
VEEPEPAGAPSHDNHDEAPSSYDHNGDYDDHMNNVQEEEDDDDVDFNLGGNTATSNGAGHQEVAAPSYSTTRGPSAKEDG